MSEIPSPPKSDDQKLLHGRINDDQIQAFLKAKAPRLACVCCGQDSFQLYTEDFGQGLAQIHYGTRASGRFIPAILLSCNNCGYFHSFRWQTVAEWIEQNPPPPPPPPVAHPDPQPSQAASPSPKAE